MSNYVQMKRLGIVMDAAGGEKWYSLCAHPPWFAHRLVLGNMARTFTTTC